MLGREDVAFVVTLGAVEGAELAIDVADVGVIDVAVDDVGDDVVALAAVRGALALAAAGVGEFAELGERGVVKLLGFLGRDAAAVKDLALISVSRRD